MFEIIEYDAADAFIRLSRNLGLVSGIKLHRCDTYEECKCPILELLPKPEDL